MHHYNYHHHHWYRRARKQTEQPVVIGLSPSLSLFLSSFFLSFFLCSPLIATCVSIRPQYLFLHSLLFRLLCLFLSFLFLETFWTKPQTNTFQGTFTFVPLFMIVIVIVYCFPPFSPIFRLTYIWSNPPSLTPPPICYHSLSVPSDLD